MSEQTAKIEKVRENIKSYPNKMDKTGKNPTVYVHGITVQGDATEWEYHSFKQQCEVFIAGQEATFTTEKKQNGQYTNFKIVPVRVEKKSFGGGFNGASKFNPEFEEKRQRMIIAQSSISSAVAFYGETSGKSEEKVLEFAGKIFEWVINKSK